MMKFPGSIHSKLPKVGTTIFSVMSGLARETGAVNLSQGFPDFDAGFFLRAKQLLPKQGTSGSWKVHSNYIKDLFELKYSGVKDKDLEYA